MAPWCIIWVITVSSANSLPAICHPTLTRIALYWSKTTSLDPWLVVDLTSRWSLIEGPVVGSPNQHDWTPVKRSNTLIPRNDAMRYDFKKWSRNTNMLQRQASMQFHVPHPKQRRRTSMKIKLLILGAAKLGWLHLAPYSALSVWCHAIVMSGSICLRPYPHQKTHPARCCWFNKTKNGSVQQYVQTGSTLPSYSILFLNISRKRNINRFKNCENLPTVARVELRKAQLARDAWIDTVRVSHTPPSSE